MSTVISIMNEKGGVGKTATATTLAYLLAKKGKKTALIDFDGQGNASTIMGVENPNALQTTIASLLNTIITDGELPPREEYIIHTKSGVDLIPSNSQLFTLERNLCNVDFRETKLSEFVDTIKSSYEYIIIDCMPQIGTPMINAMLASDYIIVPTQSEILSAQGLGLLMKHINTLRNNSGHCVQIAGILVTMISERTIIAAQVRDMLKTSFGNMHIFTASIPRSIKVAEACLYGQTICEYMPDNPAALAYEMFVDELLQKMAN